MTSLRRAGLLDGSSFKEARVAQTLLSRQEGELLVLTLNRPESRNALTPALAEALGEAVSRAQHDANVRAIVLSGAGGHFCSGIDLAELMGLLGTDPSPENRRAIVRKALGGQLHPAIRALWSSGKPTVAALRGSAAGFGLDLACACDLRVVGESAKLSYTFTRRGLAPDGGTGHHLTRLIGLGRALELLLLAEAFDGRQALAWGLANRAVEDGAVETLALELARRAGENAPLAVAAAKARLKALASFGDELAEEVELAAACAGSDDALEGVAAFLEKRAPKFRGA